MLAKLKDGRGNTVLVCVESIDHTRVTTAGTEILMKGREQGVQVAEDPDAIYEACMEASRDASMRAVETSQEVVNKFMADLTEQLKTAVGELGLDDPPSPLGGLGFGLGGGLGRRRHPFFDSAVDLGGRPTLDEDEKDDEGGGG